MIAVAYGRIANAPRAMVSIPSVKKSSKVWVFRSGIWPVRFLSPIDGPTNRVSWLRCIRVWRQELPSGRVMDVEIRWGEDFVKVLKARVIAADVVLVVIGPRWADLLPARGGDDFVMIEIKTALDHGKRVIPVLVASANMPRADALPEAIRPLARRNAVALRPEHFKADCRGLITALEDSLAEQAVRTEIERKAAQSGRLETEAHAAARAIAAEERGRAQTAAGLSAENVRKAGELANWDFIKDGNNIQDLRDHLARFPGGTTEGYALAKLDGLVWTELAFEPVTELLRDYLDEFPTGANAGAAHAAIAALVITAKPEYFVSYASGDGTPEGQVREDIVNRLCETAERNGITIARDTNALQIGDRISTFMQGLARADRRVFIVLSDKYLKSPYCMYELAEVWRNCRQDDEEFLRRIRVFTLNDARIWTPMERALCAAHWRNESEQLETLIKEHGWQILGKKDHERLRLMKQFEYQIGDILATVTDILQPRTFEELKLYGFADPPA